MKFSERYGYNPTRDRFQIESIDQALKNKIWNLLKLCYWDEVKRIYGDAYLNHPNNKFMESLCQKLWFDYFKEPLDQLGDKWNTVLEHLRRYYFQCKWHEVYDFIEYIANQYLKVDINRKFMNTCNKVLEEEMSAYRFVKGKITRITDSVEIEAIEKATESKEQNVAKQLYRALELLSDRTNPDYRNSIKESISAVESIVMLLGTDKGTLGELLKKIDKNNRLHPALKSAFEKLYGYTSDESGIRHALMEQENVDFYDAKFMLVACSAFVNYIEGKFEKKDNS